MTTHEERTDVSGASDESQRTMQPTPPAEDRVPPQQQAPAFSETRAGSPDGRLDPRSEVAAPVQHSREANQQSSQSSTEETLFGDADLADLRSRWAGVQAAFVDDPKDCVQKADVLVSDLVDQLTTGFAHARSRLEEQWSRGEEASTEDLRLALMHYREFFERLLAV